MIPSCNDPCASMLNTLLLSAEELAALPPLPLSPIEPSAREEPFSQLVTSSPFLAQACSSHTSFAQTHFPAIPIPPPPLTLARRATKAPSTTTCPHPVPPTSSSSFEADQLAQLTCNALLNKDIAHQVSALRTEGISFTEMELSASGRYVVFDKSTRLGQFKRDAATGPITYEDSNPVNSFFVNAFLEEFPMEQTLEELLRDATVPAIQTTLDRLHQRDLDKYSEFATNLTPTAFDHNQPMQLIQSRLVSFVLPITYFRAISALLQCLSMDDAPEEVRQIYYEFAPVLQQILFPHIKKITQSLIRTFFTRSLPVCSLFQGVTKLLATTRESICDVVRFEMALTNRKLFKEFRDWRAAKKQEGDAAADLWMERLHNKAMRELQSYQRPEVQKLLTIHPDCLLAIAHHNLLIEIREKYSAAKKAEQSPRLKQKYTKPPLVQPAEDALSPAEAVLIDTALLAADMQSDSGAPMSQAACSQQKKHPVAPPPSSSSAAASASSPAQPPEELLLIRDIIHTDRSPCKFRLDSRVARWNKPNLRPSEVTDPTNQVFFDTVPSRGPAAPLRMNQYAGLSEDAAKRAICHHAFPCADILVSSQKMKQKYGSRYTYSDPATGRMHCGWEFTGNLDCAEGLMPGTLRIAINPNANLIYHVEFVPDASLPPSSAPPAAPASAVEETTGGWQTTAPYNTTIDDHGVLAFTLPDGRKLSLRPNS